MSSNDKRDLTTKNNSTKEASATVIGDVVTLPPDSDDVIFTTICDDSINGVVDAELEMSYDKENWCPAVAEEFTAGESVVGWGNEKYIDTIPTPDLVGTCSVGDHESRSACEAAGGTWTPTEHKNKYAQGTESYDTAGNEVGTATGTRDVLYNFIKKDKPFNLNWWHKSGTVPNTVVDVPAVKGITHAYNKDHINHQLRSPSNPFGSGNFSPDETWSYSFWFRTEGTNGDWAVLTGALQSDGTGTNDVQFLRGGSAGKAKLLLGGATADYTGVSGPVVFDGNWHHVVIACDGTGSTSSHTIGAAGSDHKVYIDGVFQAITETAGSNDYSSSVDKLLIAQGWGGANYFLGYVAEVSFWTSDLASDADGTTGASSKIQSLYNSGVPTDLTGESGLHAWYRMGATTNDDGSASPWIQDATGNSGALEPYTNSTTQGDSGALHTLDTSESIYRAPVTETRKNNYNPIIFRHGNKDPFSNQKHLDLSKGTGEYKNKSANAPVNIGFENKKCFSMSGAYGIDIAKSSGTMVDVIDKNKDWTLSFWVNTTTTSNVNLFRLNQATLQIHKVGQTRWTTYGDDGWQNLVCGSSSDITDGKWNHIVITFKGIATGTALPNSETWESNPSGTDPGITVYLNGSEISSDGFSTQNDFSGNLNAPNNVLQIHPSSVDIDYDQIFLSTDTKNSTWVTSAYNSGIGTDLSSESNGIVLLTANDMSTATNLADATTITNSASGSSGYAVDTAAASVVSVRELTSSDLNASSAEYKSIQKDIFDSKLGKDKSFTINKWFKSSEPPETTTTYPFSKCMEIAESSDTGEGFLEIQNTIGSTTQTFHEGAQNVTPTALDWTFSMWYKSPGSSAPDGATNRVLMYFGSNWFLYLDTSGVFTLKNWYVESTVTMPSGKDLFDGEWHFLTFAWRHDPGGSTSSWFYKMNAANDTGNEGDPGSSVWIDGVPFDFTSTYHTVPPARDYYDMGVGNYSPEQATTTEACPGKYAHIALEAKALTTSEVVARYNNGVPLDLSSEVEFYLNFEDETGTLPITLSSSSDLTESGKGYNNSGTPGTDYPTAITGDLSSIVALSDTSMKGTPTYTDDYLPVLFNNGAKKTVPAVLSNEKCLKLPDTTANSIFKMGTVAQFDDDDDFFFRRIDDSWTISFWMKMESGTIIDSGYDQGVIYTCGQDSDYAGHALVQRGGGFWVWIGSGGGTHIGYSYYDATGWDDGNWHHYAVTWKANANGEGAANFADHLKLYRNGSLLTKDGGANGGTWLDATGQAVDTGSTGEFHFGHPYYTTSNRDGAIAQYNEIAVWKTDLPATGSNSIATLYNSGDFYDVSTVDSSNLKRYYRFENSDGTDSSGNHTGVKGSSATYENLDSSADNYQEGVAAYDTFGNGLTASFTKKLGSGTTWNPAGTETTKLLLSFDGFEDTADAFNAYGASSLLDGNWHNLQITWDGAASSSPPTDTEDVKVFVDGAALSISDSGNNKLNKTAAPKHFKYTEGTFIPGTFGASGWKETGATTDYIYPFQGALDNLSLHSEVTDLTKAKEFYGKDTSFEGKPHNYQMSASLTYANVEGWWTFDNAADNLTTVQDKTSNNIDLTLNNFASGGNGYVTMTNSDSIYVNNLLKGEGLTLSITRNLKDDGTWVDTQDEDPRLIMSFNGIERDAEYWVAYNTHQTGLSPAVNLLDGLWHSVTLSYQGLGNATDGYTNYTYDLPNDEIRFGPTQIGGTNQPYHFSLAFDGQVLKDINGGKGYNLAKGGATGSDANAGFVLQNKHLRHTHSDATYIPTTYLASGISEVAGQDSIYAFQGGFDESSFHSDSWWTTNAWDYNQEKPLTIYGISSGLSNSIRFAPYNMRSPSDIEVTAGQNQYIDPNPYNASTNANGGMEVYYRWGDTTGDCSQSIRDVKSHETSPVNTNRDIVAQNILHSDATLLDTDASESTLYDKDLIENNSGTYKMYQEKLSSTTLGGLNVNAIKISGCGANKCQQQGVLAPRLPHMRVKWSGNGSCDLGEDKCRAQLWFRRRKK